MTMQDPISDMLTRIRNAQARFKANVNIPLSKVKQAIADVLVSEGYITSWKMLDQVKHPTMQVSLKYHNGEPVISSLKRISKPSLRKYEQHTTLPKVQDGLGVAIISTSKGVMTDRKARKLKLGGEVLVYVS